MVHRTYAGLGSRELAVAEFEGLRPWASRLLEMQWECEPMKADYMAMGIACDGLETAAYHFTRRRHFYGDLDRTRPSDAGVNGRLKDRAEAVSAFLALRPYHAQLLKLRTRCRPFGGDYLALGIAMDSLDTAALHFTREAGFYGARFDSSGPLRPPPGAGA